MKVGIISDTFCKNRGVDKIVYYLAKGLIASGYDVKIYTSKYDITGFDVEVIPIPRTRIFSLQRFKSDCDIIISHSQVLGNLLAKKQPFVFVYHGFPFNIMKYAIIAKMEVGKQLRKADHIVSISKYCKEELKKQFNRDSEVIYDGVDTEHFKPMKIEKKFDICAFKRGKKYKYKKEDIIEQFKRDYKVLEIYGVSEEELPRCYNESRLFVSPSLWEGFGLSYAEAMSCGVPALGFNRTAIPEVVGIKELICEDIDEMKQRISELLKNDAERKRLGVLARERIVQNFDYRRMVKGYDDIIKKLVP